MKKEKIIQKTIGIYFNILAYINKKKLRKDGFNLFCNPFARKIKPHQMDFLKSGLFEKIKLENHDIQTYKWGNGTKHVLLIHGWASHSFRWKNYVKALLKNNYTVYAFDAPAHGLSSGKMLHLVIYAKVINTFLNQNKQIKNLLCHSVGGFASIYYLYHNVNNEIEKIVIMGAPGEADDFFDFYKKTLGLSTKATNLIKNEFELRLGKTPSFFSSKKFAENLSQNALIVHDLYDEATDFKNSVNLNKVWKNSELILTEGLGHDLKTKEIVNKVVDYLG